MLEEWAIISTYEGLADAIRAKAGGLYQTITLVLVDEARRDPDRMREVVTRLHAKCPGQCQFCGELQLE